MHNIKIDGYQPVDSDTKILNDQDSPETIFALSTIAGKSGVAIIRISGEKSISCLMELGGKIAALKPNEAKMVKLISPFDDEPLDQAIVIYFKAPHSFTGEDIVELHLHGSLAVINDTISVLAKISYLRPAEPGEFSKRAFMNGKLDLTRAEGLADLINAETSIQRKIALRQLGGELENIYETWRQEVIEILAKTEALIDFPDEDLPIGVLSSMRSQISALISKINEHLAFSIAGENIMKGIEIALVGIPNVGKSSLLNALSKRDAAIVSEIAGTTRDIIEVRLNLKGYLVTLYDTAGLRDTNEAIEAEGVNRTRKKIESSDIIVVVVDLNNKESLEVLSSDFLKDKDTIIVGNKSDLNKPPSNVTNSEIIAVSAKFGHDIDVLLSLLASKVSQKYSVSSNPIITNARYRHYLKECLGFLNVALSDKSLELLAYDIRNAANSIGSITGKVEVEEILDKIFSSFCIGK